MWIITRAAAHEFTKELLDRLNAEEGEFRPAVFGGYAQGGLIEPDPDDD